MRAYTAIVHWLSKALAQKSARYIRFEEKTLCNARARKQIRVSIPFLSWNIHNHFRGRRVPRRHQPQNKQWAYRQWGRSVSLRHGSEGLNAQAGVKDCILREKSCSASASTLAYQAEPRRFAPTSYELTSCTLTMPTRGHVVHRTIIHDSWRATSEGRFLLKNQVQIASINIFFIHLRH